MENKTDQHKEAFLRTLISELKTDVLFECFAGLLVKSSDEKANAIHVIPKENYSRNYNNDIIPASRKQLYEQEKYFEENDQNWLILYSSRNAILDYLPEDFFSEPDNTDEYLDESTGKVRSTNEIEEYRALAKAHQESAERFFRPLEIEYNKLRIHRELKEVDSIESFDESLKTLWDEYEVNNERWLRFIRTLHLVSNIVGDLEKTKILIEFVLGNTVDLHHAIDSYCKVSKAEQKQWFSGGMILGYNTNVGNEVYDYLETLSFKIHGLTTNEYYEFSNKQTSNGKLLEAIKNHYFPLNAAIQVDFSIDMEEEAIPIVGFSTVLQ